MARILCRDAPRELQRADSPLTPPHTARGVPAVPSRPTFHHDESKNLATRNDKHDSVGERGSPQLARRVRMLSVARPPSSAGSPDVL